MTKDTDTQVLKGSRRDRAPPTPLRSLLQAAFDFCYGMDCR